MRHLVSLVAAVLSCLPVVGQESPAHAWQAVDAVLKVSGKLLPDGTYRVDVPRRQPKLVNEYGFTVPPTMVLTYAAFAGSPSDATVVGDTCVLGPEVNPVIDALRKGGIEIVAIHNHMLGGTPNFIFLHFQGKGDAVALAKPIRAAWDEMEKGHAFEKRRAAKAPQPDWKAVSTAIGLPGAMTEDGMFKVLLPRPH